VCAGLVLCAAAEARAQSTASFPEAPGSASAKSAPPPSPPPATVPAAPSAAPVVTPAAPAPAPTTTDSTTESRYPTLPGPVLPAQPVPSAGTAVSPPILPYRAGLSIPPGYRVEHRPATSMIVGGLTTLVIAYGAAIGVGVGDNFKNGTGWTAVPVLGPWAAIGARSFHCNNDPLAANDCVKNAFSEVQTIAILSADAVVQATGAVLFLVGLGSGTDELVRSDVEAHVRVTPRAVGRDGFGIGFDGRF